jgi:hypothetical protein
VDPIFGSITVSMPTSGAVKAMALPSWSALAADAPLISWLTGLISVLIKSQSAERSHAASDEKNMPMLFLTRP